MIFFHHTGLMGHSAAFVNIYWKGPYLLASNVHFLFITSVFRINSTVLIVLRHVISYNRTISTIIATSTTYYPIGSSLYLNNFPTLHLFSNSNLIRMDPCKQSKTNTYQPIFYQSSVLAAVFKINNNVIITLTKINQLL